MGIPLYDELKSLCVEFYPPGGRSLALLHCRANRRFDLEAAAKIFRSTRPLTRLAADELRERFGMIYGTVNPFAGAEQFVQLFDEGILVRRTPPYTMMTNAGDLTWAVEFYPQDAVEALRGCTEVHVAPIAADQAVVTPMPVFGILTGNGPESGQALWQLLNEAVRRGVVDSGRPPGDLVYPRVLVHSEPEMGLSMELVERGDAVWGVVSRAMDELCSAGANVLAIACNTTQWYANRIRERCEGRGAKFISMAEVTIDYVRSNGVSDLTIVGIPIVSALGDHSAYAPLASLGVQPVGERVRTHLQELGYQVKGIALGEKSSEAMNTLRHVLRDGVETHNVVIALTEISVLLHRFPRYAEQLAGRRIVDPLRLYAEALARLYLAALPPATLDEEPWGENSAPLASTGGGPRASPGLAPSPPTGANEAAGFRWPEGARRESHEGA